MGAPSTKSETKHEGAADEKPVPGALLVFSDKAPMLRAIRVAPGPVTLGRDDANGAIALPDEKASRAHAQLVFDGPGWTVKDLGSRNGTFIDGHRIEGEARAPPNAVVRLAQSIVLLCDDIRRFTAATVSTDRFIIGPTLRAPLDRIAMAARGGANVLITGESGSGKELAARTFHEAASAKGPLIAVNCATIEKGVADRLFFGALKGTYTDVKETVDGYVQAADGGSLFLDELGELGAEVQAKLLRVVESGEVMRLGESTPKKVKLRVVAATHKDLRRAVDQGGFRADLFFRLAQVEVRLPPLRERREEIPFIISLAIAEEPVRIANASLVEAVLLRSWPGNVRELLAQVKKAALAAHADGSKSVRDVHLDAQAGIGPSRQAGPRAAAGEVDASAAAGAKQPTKEEVEAVLRERDWNVAETARRLDLHRNQLNRLIKRYGLKRPDGQAAVEIEDDDAA
jgi:DNA-binding NtrC family response regulator